VDAIPLFQKQVWFVVEVEARCKTEEPRDILSECSERGGLKGQHRESFHKCKNQTSTSICDQPPTFNQLNFQHTQSRVSEMSSDITGLDTTGPHIRGPVPDSESSKPKGRPLNE
jgi:hypothetical protein